ncbi:MAG: hypothetical protein ACI9Q9_001029, partial [Flavobacterium sp.]
SYRCNIPSKEHNVILGFGYHNISVEDIKKPRLTAWFLILNTLFIPYFPKIYLSVNCACQTSKAEAFF